MQLIQIGHEASLGRLLNVASTHLFRQFNLSSAWIVYGPFLLITLMIIRKQVSECSTKVSERLMSLIHSSVVHNRVLL